MCVIINKDDEVNEEGSFKGGAHFECAPPNFFYSSQ